MDKKLNFLMEKIKECGFNIQHDDGSDYVISDFSPYGQDCNAYIDTQDDAALFVENIREYASDFDVSYEAYLWLDSEGHGANGAPYDMRDVYEDMEWWKNRLEDLADTLEVALDTVA